MVIKVFFAVLVLSTVAVVAVILAVHFRVKRHLQDKAAPLPEGEVRAGDAALEAARADAAHKPGSTLSS